MAAKLKKNGKKRAPKPATKPARKIDKKGKRDRNDTDEMTDLERDVDRGEDVELGASRPSVKEEFKSVELVEEEDDGGDLYEYGERGILSDEDENEDNY
jgi:hypothetical protein